MAAQKWKIRNLKKSLPLKEAADRILEVRMRRLSARVRKYLKAESAEELHQIRIAIRRLRYSMELFTDCYNTKMFFRFYSIIEQLQDRTGEVRDIFILKEKILAFAALHHIPSPDEVLRRIEEEEIQLQRQMNQALDSFISSKELQYFRKLVK